MTKPLDLLSAFDRAANRRSYEVKRLDQSKKRELYEEMRAACKPHLDKIRETRERQSTQREDDMARARLLVTLQKRQLDYKPPETTQSQRIDRDRLEKLAAVEVEAKNASEIAVIKVEMRQELSAAIDSFLGRQSEFAAERHSVDLARARWSELRAATSVHEPERGGEGHER